MTGKIGIEIGGVEFCVQHLPERKNPYLTIQKGNTIYGVARFTSEDSADFFLTEAEKAYVRRLND